MPEGVSETSPLAREAIRVYGRYEVEVIEAYTLCPWAERSRREGHTRQLVLDEPLDADRVLAAIDVLAADARVEVGFLLFPCCTLPRVACRSSPSSTSMAAGWPCWSVCASMQGAPPSPWWAVGQGAWS